MFNPIKTSNYRLGLIGVVFLISLVLWSSGIPVFSGAAQAAKPEKCTPWPECKNGDGTGDSTGYTLQFEAQADRSALTTDHRSSGNTCPGVPETDNEVWVIEVTHDQVGDENIYTSTGKIIIDPLPEPGPTLDNLLIDIFNEPSSTPVQFTRTCPDTNPVNLDGCFGSTPVSDGLLIYSIRLVGEIPNLSCQSQVSWDFAHCLNDQGVEEFLRIQTGWMESNRDPGKGKKANCRGDKHIIDTTGSDSVQFYRMQTIDGVPTIMEQDVRDMGMFITVKKN